MNKIRECPICGNVKSKIIYVQKYTSHFNHQIVSCNNCNFIFAGNIPSKKYYEEYYRSQSKYEGVREHEVHEDQAVNKIIPFVKKNVFKKSKILDVGCSTGYLLSVLRENGYKNLLGIEPAPKCSEIAMKSYGLEVKTDDLESFKTLNKYDFIILSQVLEHLVDVSGSISKISKLLKDDGYLYIGVPDTSIFFVNVIEPFGEFSTEHINFFTESALYFLMRGYTNVLMKSEGNSIHSIWQKGDSGLKSILKYIDLSESKLETIKKKINSLPKKVIIWGAGALSQRLLSTTNIKEKVLFFVDSNPNLQGAKLGDIPIYSPSVINNYKCPILVSSYNFSEEIVRTIRSKNFTNKVLTFF